MKRKTNKQKFKEQYREIMQDWDGTEETPQILKVVWEDARTLLGTSDYIGIKENGLLTANTIGYLVHEDDKRIAICGFLFPDEHHSMFDPINNTAFRDVHIIPKGWIKNVLVLKTDWETSKKFRQSNKDWFVKAEENES